MFLWKFIISIYLLIFQKINSHILFLEIKE